MGPCHHGLARLQTADGGTASSMEAANILNKQSRTVDKGWTSGLGVGRGANNSYTVKKTYYVTKCLQEPRIWTDILADSG